MSGLINVVEEVCRIAESVKDTKTLTLGKFLAQRINNPDYYLVFLGETCSGKSTILNSIADRDVLPVSGVPSTAAITEVVFSPEEEAEAFYAINKNASMERIDESLFRELSLKPDQELERLRYVVPAKGKKYAGVKLFDTPGYGSLIQEHTEVLCDFLPNADAVVYVVSYRNGFQSSDHDFLKQLIDLTRDNVPVHLLINRCPAGTVIGDRRVQEIYRNVSGLLQRPSLPVAIINSFAEEKSVFDGQVRDFINGVMEPLTSSEKKKELNEIFGEYTIELITEAKANVERLICNRELSHEEAEMKNKSIEEFVEKLRKINTLILAPRFSDLRAAFGTRLAESRKQIIDETCSEIDQQSKLSKEETTAYIKEHILPYHSQQQVKNLQFFLEAELTAIDKEIDNYLSAAAVQLEKDLVLNNPGKVYKAGQQYIKRTASKVLSQGLQSYFLKFGGAGGSAAGVANAASHALKKAGDLFGKTFSKSTHNALKHLIKKVGLTSARALTSVAAILVDTVGYTVDALTWQMILKQRIVTSAEKWAEELGGMVINNLQEMENQNKETIRQMIQETEETLTVIPEESKQDLEQLKKNMEVLNRLEQEVA